MKELYKKHRPKTLEALVGQESAVASLKLMVEKDSIPHSILLTGPSGCGKTTIARILKNHLNCGRQDFVELNCADFRGIDNIRDIRRQVGYNPISGDTRIWLIDEAHMMSKDAQNAFLKLLEDTPEWVYFMLATTDPKKLIPTIHTRCSEIKLESVTAKDLEKLVNRVINLEGLKVSKSIIEEIVEAADGSARKALVILEQVGHLGSDEEQLKAIQTTTFNKVEAINLARELSTPSASWPKVAAILKGISEQDPEGIRYLILSYSRTILLGGGPLSKRAFKIIDIFSRNFYDSKHAGLAAACWEVVFG